MLVHRCAEFTLLAFTLLEKYKIDGAPKRPLLRVSSNGDIYFYYNFKNATEKIVLDSKDYQLFCEKSEKGKKFDFHYEMP